MTVKELEKIEADAYSKAFDQIAREQREYRKGVEEGMAIMFKAMRDSLIKEGK